MKGRSTDILLAFRIAWRYFFSPKSTHAVNVIAIISVLGIALVTTSMVVILSVFNGFEVFTSSQLSLLSPHYRIVSRSSDTFSASELKDSLSKAYPQILPYLSPVLELRGMLMYQDNSQVVRLVGIDSTWIDQRPLVKEFLFDGTFSLGDSLQPSAVIGVGVGARLGVGADYLDPVELLLPKRLGRISMTMPTKNFSRFPIHVSGVLRVDQSDDDEVVYLPLHLLRRMAQYGGSEVSYLAVSSSLSKGDIEAAVGTKYRVEDRYEQHPTIYKILKIEKWVSFALLFFVLLLSLFSLVSTLGMLIIEKRHDVRLLSILGASRRMIDYILILEGWILSLSGLILGMVLGVTLVWLQDRFGLIPLQSTGTGIFLLEYYPVRLLLSDLLSVTLVIILVGAGSTYLAQLIFGWNRD